MPKGYMLSAHRSLADAEKADAYRALARPAMEAMGGGCWQRPRMLWPKKTALPSGLLIEFEVWSSDSCL